MNLLSFALTQHVLASLSVLQYAQAATKHMQQQFGHSFSFIAFSLLFLLSTL